MASSDCLDCVREKVLVPRKKAKNQSYCTHHVYQRTKRANKVKSIKDIVDRKAWTELDEKDRGGVKQKYPIEVIMRIAEEFKAEGDRALEYMDESQRTREEQVPYKEAAFNCLRVYWCLYRRRDLTDDEVRDLRFSVNERYPCSEDESGYEYMRRRTGVVTEPTKEWGPPE